ncbi:MAG: hypothetical protein OEX00_03670 [Gammaproteobacteria bacterium]|nr:hypothetical protein [Gammaproteobacteria bacterium]MDH5693036.1 hypothetical protein [Gammaproteobacteria bacterium]
MKPQDLPNEGDWYKDTESSLFQIIAVDSFNELIEIQYVDGEIGELEFENWFSKTHHQASDPNDWRLVFDEEQEEEWTLQDEYVEQVVARPWEEIDSDIYQSIY